MPIGYTFGVGHRIKVLISSNNHPRYQAGANVPIEDGEFFRRQPNDGQTYIYNGVEYAPRKAVQRIAFSPQYPTQIRFPLLGVNSDIVTASDEFYIADYQVNVFPNPTDGDFRIFADKPGKYDVVVRNIVGQAVYTGSMTEMLHVDLRQVPAGQYIVELYGEGQQKPAVKMISIH